jgi:hypothetical protein
LKTSGGHFELGAGVPIEAKATEWNSGPNLAIAARSSAMPPFRIDENAERNCYPRERLPQYG